MRTSLRWLAGCAILLGAVASSADAGQSNSLMDISHDGTLLACSNRDNGTVTIVELPAHRKLREFNVGKKPEGVSFIGETHQLAVAVYGDDKVAMFDGDSGTTLGSVDVFDEPYGVVSTRNGKSLYVTLEYPGQVLEIDPAARRIVREIPGGAFLRGIAFSPDESRLFVTEYLRASMVAIEVATGKVVDRWRSAESDNLARQLAIHPTRPKAYIPHLRSRTDSNLGDGAIFPYVSVMDIVDGDELRRKRISMDNFTGVLVTSNPWEACVAPDGKQLYVVFGGTDDLYVCNILDDDYRELVPRKYFGVGKNPRAVRVSSDNQFVYVYNALDFNIAVYDTAQLKLAAKIPVCDCPLSEEVLEGKILFYSALQPMVGRRWISCASCHPDGDPDGRTWKNPEGLRNTQSLAAMAWTHPIHWSADRDEVQDFEHTIRGQLMQGRGLIKGQVHESLGEVNKGLSARLDRLAVYANSHSIPLSPHAKQGLSDAAKRGRELFLSDETRCSTCHSGPFYTDSKSRAVAEIVRHDIGTGKEDDTEKMGPAYDTPTLLGVYRTAPYLHHGRAQSLNEVLTKYNVGDQHGKTSHLTETQIHDLVEFLISLPFESPEEEAVKLGLKRVE